VDTTTTEGGDVRRFLFSTSVLGAVFGGLGTLRSTVSGPRDWRLILMWLSWGLTVAIAIGTVAKQNENAELEE
jgi:hypothetical protein